MPRGIFSEEEKIWRQFQGSPDDRRAKARKHEFKAWMKEWRERGVLDFAENVLQIDPNTGEPLLVSDDQKEFLLDMTVRNVQLAIISAGRGSGKTFILAVYVIWRIFTHERYNISCMGGSSEQSEKIQAYITGWLRHNADIRRFLWKDVMGEVKSFANSAATFHSCSATSVRGPHTREIIIDEEAAGEERGGTRYIRAAMWEVSTSKDMRIIKSSTPHLVHGDFLMTWNEYERLGYKRYQWAIAKHISKEKDPYKIYQDTVSKHWVTNVPWSSDKTIQILRRNNSNEEWLVEALGALSISSGLVFRPADLEACICDKCLDEGKPCRPYEGYCPIVQYHLQLEGMARKKIPQKTSKALQHVGQRMLGIDYGDVAPDAYTAVGKFGRVAFILESVELTGQSNQDKIETAIDYTKKWHINTIRPDPSEPAYNTELANLGFAVHELFSFEGGKEKRKYVWVMKRFIERHNLIIPCIFKDLIRSLKNLAYDKKGNIRKADDHSFDSALYAISFYGELMDEEDISKRPKHGVAIWEGEKEATSPKVYERPEEVDEKDFNPFDEKYLRKKRNKEGTGQGVKLW